MCARLADRAPVGVVLRSRESRGGVLEAGGGRTLTPVARQLGIGVRLGRVAGVLSRTAPVRLELVTADGARSDIAVTDHVWRLRIAAVMLGGLLLATELWRRSR